MQSAPPIELTVPCPTCGPVSLELGEVVLWSRPGRLASWLTVCCPRCAGRFVHHTLPAERLLLQTFDVPSRIWEAPAEGMVDGAPTEPISYAELASFAEALAGRDTVAQLIPPSA
jgi:hypothetical protein